MQLLNRFVPSQVLDPSGGEGGGETGLVKSFAVEFQKDCSFDKICQSDLRVRAEAYEEIEPNSSGQPKGNPITQLSVGQVTKFYLSVTLKNEITWRSSEALPPPRKLRRRAASSIFLGNSAAMRSAANCSTSRERCSHFSHSSRALLSSASLRRESWDAIGSTSRFNSVVSSLTPSSSPAIYS